jgi:immunity protein 52 of polymorphic toxin system
VIEMADAFYLGAYWGARQESLDACAARLAALAKSLAEIHQDLSTWYRKGESAESATASVDLTGPDAVAMLSGGQLRKDIGGEVMAQLGFRTAVWNGRTQPVELSVTCGAYPANRPTANHVLVKFPPSDSAGGLYDPGIAIGVLKAVVDAFAPDWATFTSHALRNAQGAKPGELTVGWLTYVTRPVPNSEQYKAGSILSLGPDAASVTGEQVSQARTALTMAL